MPGTQLITQQGPLIVFAPLTQDIPESIHFDEHCVCCWYQANPTLVFPASWSSCLCLPHRDWTMAKRVKKRMSGGVSYGRMDSGD